MAAYKSDLLTAHLAEYTALRGEILELIKWRDSLVFISLAISGAIYSFAFSAQTNKNSNELALYLIAPLSGLVGGLWLVNTWRIHRIGRYIAEVVAIQIKALFPKTLTDNDTPFKIQVFSWESSPYRVRYGWLRRCVEWTIYVITFCLSGLVSQLLLLKNSKGGLWESISKVEFSAVYIFNYIMLLITFVGFLNYLYTGKKSINATRKNNL